MQHTALAEKDPAYLYPHQAAPQSAFRFLTHESSVIAGDFILWERKYFYAANDALKKLSLQLLPEQSRSNAFLSTK